MNEHQNKRSNQKLKTMCEVAVMVAVALALSYIELELGAAGGSVGFVMIPIFLICFRHGFSWGLAAGLVFGTLKCLLTEGIGYGWQAMLLDYSVAYLACGLCGLWKKPKVSGVVAGTLVGSAPAGSSTPSAASSCGASICLRNIWACRWIMCGCILCCITASICP